ncbi:C39 family peptidase [Patescibacteria group bacterium]
MKKILVPLIATVMVLLAVLCFSKLIRERDEKIYTETRANIEGSSRVVEKEVEVVVDEEPIVDDEDDEFSKELPESIMIDVPFLVQAPFGNWDEIHEDACEESSLIMLEYYLRGDSGISLEDGEDEIQRLVSFQIRNYGSFEDTSVSETVEMARDFYGRDNLRVVYDFEKERIREELAKGNPVILAVAGREIGNPYFTPPGPWYHNIVLVGYDGDTIYAHDPGTRRGAKYPYNIDVLYEVSHDFTGKKEDIAKGRRAMIIVR